MYKFLERHFHSNRRHPLTIIGWWKLYQHMKCIFIVFAMMVQYKLHALCILEFILEWNIVNYRISNLCKCLQTYRHRHRHRQDLFKVGKKSTKNHWLRSYWPTVDQTYSVYEWSNSACVAVEKVLDSPPEAWAPGYAILVFQISTRWAPGHLDRRSCMEWRNKCHHDITARSPHLQHNQMIFNPLVDFSSASTLTRDSMLPILQPLRSAWWNSCRIDRLARGLQQHRIYTRCYTYDVTRRCPLNWGGGFLAEHGM
jgi:hypothetical protein